MTKQLFIAAAFIAATGMSVPLTAQEANRPDQKIKTKSNIKNDRVCVVKITSSESGCDIIFNEASSTGEALPAAKRMHKPYVFSVSSGDNSITEITSGRDAATGLATGKRTAGTPIGGIIVKGGKNPGGGQFNKIVVQDGEFTLPADCPDGEYDMSVSWSWGASNGSSSKRCVASFTLSIQEGACHAINTKGTGGTNH
jgi:hypothetical protein